jgi:hypothetical protein
MERTVVPSAYVTVKEAETIHRGSRQSLAISGIARRCPNRFKPGPRDFRVLHLRTYGIFSRSTPGFTALILALVFPDDARMSAGAKLGHSTPRERRSAAE